MAAGLDVALGSSTVRSLRFPNKRLRNLADHPAIARIIWDRPIGGEMNRVAVTVGARAVQQALGYTGAGIGVRGHRLRCDHLARRPHVQRHVVGGEDEERAARCGLCRLRQQPHVAVRRQRSRHARLRDHRRQRVRHVRCACRHRAVGAPGQPEGARSQRPGRHQRRDCGARLGGREQGALQHPRHQPVGWRGGHRVVQHRPARRWRPSAPSTQASSS